MDKELSYSSLNTCRAALNLIIHQLANDGKHLRKKGRGIKETAKHRVNWEDSQSAFHNRIHSGVITNTNIRDRFDSKVTHPIMKQLQEFQEKDSGWALKRVVNGCEHKLV
nr:unnamed protein product [Callosobruchus analis]